MNGPNKLECYIAQDWKKLVRDKQSSLLDPIISYNEYEQ
jgi:hypothetical protein